jgi:pyruvate/2-oxoglutarate/acetoin dehydrogenase E1 component
MRSITMAEAINEAICEEMRRDQRVILLGEDVGAFGGPFMVTKGIFDEFGADRVRDTPISEAAIIGCAVGAAVAGWRPIAELQYSDFLATGFDQLVNQAAKIRLMSGGKINVPMVLRAPIGARVRGAQHDQCPEAWCVHTPGLKVAIPSTAYDAKGLLKSAIRDDNPVVFFEHKLLYGNRSASAAGQTALGTPELQRAAGPEVPEDEYLVPLGVAAVRREGNDITVVATALMVHKALEAAEQLQETGISVEVIDPRTLVPLDKETILKSVQKTGRALVVTEETRTASCAAEISAMIAEEAFDYLDAPVVRLCTMDMPLPFAPIAQRAVIPDALVIGQAIARLMGQ